MSPENPFPSNELFKKSLQKPEHAPVETPNIMEYNALSKEHTKTVLSKDSDTVPTNVFTKDQQYVPYITPETVAQELGAPLDAVRIVWGRIVRTNPGFFPIAQEAPQGIYPSGNREALGLFREWWEKKKSQEVQPGELNKKQLAEQLEASVSTLTRVWDTLAKQSDYVDMFVTRQGPSGIIQYVTPAGQQVIKEYIDKEVVYAQTIPLLNALRDIRPKINPQDAFIANFMQENPQYFFKTPNATGDSIIDFRISQAGLDKLKNEWRTLNGF